MEQIREALLERGKRIEASAIRDQEAMDMSVPQAEIIDIAQTLEQIGRDSSLAEQGRRELVMIERALAKIATGSFGACEDCGEEIPPRRLMIVPEARLCANCQAFEEKQSLRGRYIGSASAR